MNVQSGWSPTRARRVLVYHFDEACRSVMEEGEVIPIEELQRRLQQCYGVKCRQETIARTSRGLASPRWGGPLRLYCELNEDYAEHVGQRRRCKPRVWKKYTADEESLNGET